MKISKIATYLGFFKKPFILKKIDPAQLCNKELVKIDPSQIRAIFKKRIPPGSIKQNSDIVSKIAVQVPKEVKSSRATSEELVSGTSQKPNAKTMEDINDIASENSTKTNLEVNKENKPKAKNSKEQPAAKILPSLSNRLSMQFGVDCTVSIDLPAEAALNTSSIIKASSSSDANYNPNTNSKYKATPDLNMKDIINLSNEYTKSADEEFPEFNKLMKDFDH